MGKYLKKELAGLILSNADSINSMYNGRDVVSEILNGKILLLPNNLYIWATMNTSDQSLFPIDSAFKRRWDWKYVPIDTEKENWAIDVNGKLYSWSSFLKEINARIFAKTRSEDKQLGFYFCMAENNKISTEKFVGKVLFYIYNDVFKDYGFSDDFFHNDEGEMAFRDYFKGFGKYNCANVERFLTNLEVEEFDGSQDETEEYESPEEAEDVTDPKELTATQQLRKDYWTDFLNYAKGHEEYAKAFNTNRKTCTNKWYNFSIGASDCYIVVEQTRMRRELSVGLYFRETTDNFYLLRDNRTEIEEAIGLQFDWRELPERRASYIVHVVKDIDFEAGDRNTTQFDFIIEKMILMKKVFLEYLK